MKNKSLKKILGVVVITLAMGIFSSCESQNREVVISSDVKQEVKEEDKLIEENIQNGNSYLEEGKYEDAKKEYEKAISIDKLNKHTYLQIKDNYVQKGRFDDAFYIIKLAIDNKVDTDNMKSIQEDIKKNFNTIILENSVYQNKAFNLPKEASFKLNNEEEIKENISWDIDKVDTTKVGTFNYEGFIQQYGRKVTLTLKVLPTISEKKIGYVENVYEKNGKRYLDLNEIEFYRDEKALEEAIKDVEAALDDDGTYFVPDGYYIRDNNKTLKAYEISNNSKQSLCAFVINKQDSTIDLKEVSFQQFRDYTNNKEYRAICWVNIENNIVTKVEMQFTP